MLPEGRPDCWAVWAAEVNFACVYFFLYIFFLAGWSVSASLRLCRPFMIFWGMSGF
jgi:cytochrome b561